MRTPLCEDLGIQYPVIAFTPSEHVAAAVSRAGGLGVLGCVRFNDPDELDAVLDWMDANTDGRPYGVDIVMPNKVPTEGSAGDLTELGGAHRRKVIRVRKEDGPRIPDPFVEADAALGGLLFEIGGDVAQTQAGHVDLLSGVVCRAVGQMA